MIFLPKVLYEIIKKCALDGMPEEICGIVGGRSVGDVKYVEEIYLMENIDHSSEHFSIAPKEQLAAVKDMRSKGLVPLGNFHSHTKNAANPSDEDRRFAFDKTASYMIISVMDINKPILRAFTTDGENMKEELIVIKT